MIEFVIAATAFFTAIMVFFAGFGLGTILMPVVAIFFPVAAAVVLTAFVHLFDNLFKVIFMWRHIRWAITWSFGIPSVIAAIAGALLLSQLSIFPDLYSYEFWGFSAIMTPIKLTIGFLLVFFATLEWAPVLNKVHIPKRVLPLGGLLSGFFGGLSGHQGAFRSAFLIHTDLSKSQFIATSSAIASLVDITRLLVYGINFSLLMSNVERNLIIIAALAAFSGVLVGKFGLQSVVTLGFMHKLIAVLLYLIGFLLILGLI